MKKNKTCPFPQYGELKKLFGHQRPSGRLFEKLLKPLPPETQKQYYDGAFFLFMNAFPTVNAHYRAFLLNLSKQQPDRFLAYLFSTSGMGELRCTLEDTDLLIKVSHLLVSKQGNVKNSIRRLAFSLLMTFRMDMKVNTLRVNIETFRFYPETFFELSEYVRIYE